MIVRVTLWIVLTFVPVFSINFGLLFKMRESGEPINPLVASSLTNALIIVVIILVWNVLRLMGKQFDTE